MAEIPVTLNGVLYDLLGRTTRRVVFIGDASYTNLGVGGGPMPGGPQPPLGIWGGPFDPPHPDIGFPGPQPHPEHPIVLPPPATGPADDNGFIKPPPPGGGWAYHEDHGWMYAPGGQTPGPKTTA